MPDSLDQAFSALADPTRRAILLRLSRGAATAGELAEPFEISQPAVSRHLKVLERAGMITRHPEAQWRICRLRPEGLRPAYSFLERYRRFWESSIDALQRYVESLPPPAKAANEEDGDA